MRKNALISMIVVALLFSSCFPAYANGEIYYKVKPGDTLYGIGKKFGLSYRSIMQRNDLQSVLIKPGWKLALPSGGFEVHTVKQGENLYRIARRYGVRVAEIKAASRMAAGGPSGALIQPGMKLLIPAGSNSLQDYRVQPVFSSRGALTKEDIRLLAKLIHAEARGESLKGQVAVGAVIMNRLASSSFPGSLREIVFQRTNGIYQFTPVKDGQINLEPDRVSIYAAEQAIKGNDPTGGALFFYNPETSSDQWIKTLSVTRIIGNHVFAK